MSLPITTAVAALALVGTHVVEAARKSPPPPARPEWLPEGEHGYLLVDGLRLRYLRAGQGRPVLLLHTLRTQLELFREVVPSLAREFEVHAIDLPGHGHSSIPPGAYDPKRFLRAVRAYLQARALENVVVAGESIGGALGLTLAAEQDPRVARVVAINSYDYGRGRGIHRGSALAAVLFNLARVPLLGPAVWRLRWQGLFARVMRGSVHDPQHLPADLVQALHEVGNRPGHYRAFLSLIRDFPAWEGLREAYPRIRLPVTLVYGEHEWSRAAERRACQALIPDARLETVTAAGHLMSLDRPEAVIEQVRLAGRS